MTNRTTHAPPVAGQLQYDSRVANLSERQRIATERTQARWAWLTPVPVDEERAASNPAFRGGANSWSNTDITALADAIRAFDEPVIDLVEVFGGPDL